ncbi:MAG: hypothetical protein Greene041679_304 [Parcubacteria group bacterium Greene0416_79]|nr:MAG: hypothetical protein Greene041679_304 [Parcubacteria group bacterium Greene0416_79]
MREEGGETRGVRARFSGGNRTALFASPLREWLPIWSAQETIALLSKPSALSDGLLLLLLGNGGGEERVVLRNIKGLTALPSPALSYILYSKSTDSGVELFLYESASQESRGVSFETLPEKCAWQKDEKAFYCGVPLFMPGGSYPDVWYQSAVAFEDELWRLDHKSGVTTLLLETSAEADTPLDISKPFLSPDERFLIFTNKTDGTLWSVQLKP